MKVEPLSVECNPGVASLSGVGGWWNAPVCYNPVSQHTAWWRRVSAAARGRDTGHGSTLYILYILYSNVSRIAQVDMGNWSIGDKETEETPETFIISIYLILI